MTSHVSFYGCLEGRTSRETLRETLVLQKVSGGSATVCLCVVFYVFLLDKKDFLTCYSDVNALSALNLADVFVADYRLLPEHEFADAVEDVYNAYLYLISERQLPAESIFLYGISSGGGLAVKAIQEILENETKSVPVPGGAVLMCPFVDYTEPKGSTKEYIKHDLIVNQVSCSTSVQE
jgi:hypothetical protein